jgi:predicted signal transduction protein with EAL and GGDEF domain
MQNHRNEAVVETMVTLGHAFGISVTAEGIETPSQAEQVLKMECDEGQGYLYGPPMPGSEFLSLIHTNNRSAATINSSSLKVTEKRLRRGPAVAGRFDKGALIFRTAL